MLLSDKLKDNILDSIGEGVFTVDKNFKVNFFNKAAEKITGHLKEEVLGKFCKYIFRSEQCFSDCPIATVLKTKQNIFDYTYSITTNKGNKLPIKINAAVLYDDNNDPIGGVVSFRDLCEFELLGKNLMTKKIFQGMIGYSKQMQEIFELIDEISESNAPVFIHGESGTGKELVANAIQKTSSRNEFPYLKINCSVFPSHLLASELFGHVKGAFTDAIKDRQGRFEIVNNGTIFLDEVAEMPLQMQIQLLRVLQEGTFERVGESITRYSDVRVIAATNQNIQDALRRGTFRDDLFYRLNVIPIYIPPLRERKEDIIPLVKHFLNKFSIYYKKEIFEIEEAAIDVISDYSWPGNIRELENVIEYAFVRTTKKDTIEKIKLPNTLLEYKTTTQFTKNITPVSITNSEKSELLAILEKNRWNKALAAKELGIGRTTLWRKLKKYSLIT